MKYSTCLLILSVIALASGDNLARRHKGWRKNRKGHWTNDHETPICTFGTVTVTETTTETVTDMGTFTIPEPEPTFGNGNGQDEPTETTLWTTVGTFTIHEPTFGGGNGDQDEPTETTVGSEDDKSTTNMITRTTTQSPTETVGVPDDNGDGNPTDPSSRGTISGFGTWFTDVETVCEIRPSTEGYYVALNWKTGMNQNEPDPDFCGKCISITGPRGTIEPAKIVDVCGQQAGVANGEEYTACDFNDATHIDIWGKEAYALVADPEEGVVDMTWKYVDC